MISSVRVYKREANVIKMKCSRKIEVEWKMKNP